MYVYVIDMEDLTIDEVFREEGLTEEDLDLEYGDSWFYDLDEARNEVEILNNLN